MSISPPPKHNSLPHMYALAVRVSISRALTCLQAQYEALQSNLKNVEQELAQTRTSLTETKRTFESAREEWQADKRTLEDAIVDMTAAEKNLAEDRLSRESDAQTDEKRVRVSKPLADLDRFFADFCFVEPRLLRRGIHVRLLRMLRPSSLSRTSNSDYTTFKYLSATIGRLRRLHKPNWPLLKAVGVSNGNRSTEKLPISPPGTVFL